MRCLTHFRRRLYLSAAASATIVAITFLAAGARSRLEFLTYPAMALGQLVIPGGVHGSSVLAPMFGFVAIFLEWVVLALLLLVVAIIHQRARGTDGAVGGGSRTSS